MVARGIRFGMILQFAVGPICLMVFRTGSTGGFLLALPLVCAVAIVDACFITLAGTGIGAVAARANVQKYFKLFGFAVMLFFGINTLAGAFGFPLLPKNPLFSDAGGNSLFLQGLILTASNPMTILFWSGVFSAEIAAHGLGRRELVLFGTGCVLSTLLFLSAVAALGTAVSGAISPSAVKWMNVAVGIMMIVWGIRLLLGRKGSRSEKEKRSIPEN